MSRLPVASTKAATIAAGQSESGVIHTNKLKLSAVVMPSAWTAAAITLLGSFNGTDFYPIHDAAGTEVSITTAASRCVMLDTTLRGLPPYIKVRSGTTATPVAQVAERVVHLIVAG